MVKQLKVYAIIITYQPQKELLEKTISSIKDQVNRVILVSNDSAGALVDFQSDSVEIIELGSNFGIAKAQNVGLAYCMEHNVDFVVLSDQDTIFPEAYVKKIIFTFEENQEKHDNIAAIGPNVCSTMHNEKELGFMVFSNFSMKKVHPESGSIEVSQLIASGKLLHVKSFAKVGFFNEALFIDWVDFEWCWRAKKKGYSLLGCADLQINHKLGDSVTKVNNKPISLRKAVRHYFITRNAIYLAFYCQAIEWKMRLWLIIKSFKYLLGFSLLAKPRLEHMRYTFIGFVHGIFQKLGPYA